MGCGDSAEMRPAISIDQQFAELNLMYLITGPFECELEEKIFKAINVCRAVPNRFVQICRQVKQTFPLAKHAKHSLNLFKTMENTGRKPPVKYDDFCNQACRRNNEVVVQRNEMTPVPGGNIIIYT